MVDKYKEYIKRINPESGLCKINDNLKKEISKVLLDISLRENKIIPKSVVMQAFWIYKTTCNTKQEDKY